MKRVASERPKQTDRSESCLQKVNEPSFGEKRRNGSSAERKNRSQVSRALVAICAVGETEILIEREVSSGLGAHEPERLNKIEGIAYLFSRTPLSTCGGTNSSCIEKIIAVGISAMWPSFHSRVCWGRSLLNMSSSPPGDASEWYLRKVKCRDPYCRIHEISEVVDFDECWKSGEDGRRNKSKTEAGRKRRTARVAAEHVFASPGDAGKSHQERWMRVFLSARTRLVHIGQCPTRKRICWLVDLKGLSFKKQNDSVVHRHMGRCQNLYARCVVTDRRTAEEIRGRLHGQRSRTSRKYTKAMKTPFHSLQGHTRCASTTQRNLRTIP